MKQKFTIFLFILGLFLPFSFVLADIILSSHKYAWSDNVGYINFENVIVDDNSLSGYAWSANKGFINFSPLLGGVLNDGGGNLSGSAWGEQLGWIDFDNVSIGVDGKFSGTAAGSLVGTITFDCTFCDIETDWREAATDSLSNKSSSSRVIGIRNENVIPADLNNIIIPSILDLPSGSPVTVVPSQNIPAEIGEGGGTASIIDAIEASALFDVISEPIQSIAKSPVSFIIFSIIAEISIILLVIFIVRKIRLYIIRRSKVNQNQNEII